MSILAYGVVAWLFLIGLYGMATSRNLIHMVICLSVTQSATYVLLLSIGYRRGAGPPIFVGPSSPDVVAAVDPVVQALTLTDIVVGATIMALLLALAVQVHKHKGTLDPGKLAPMHG